MRYDLEKLREAVRIIKTISKMAEPNYELPSDSNLERVAEQILALGALPKPHEYTISSDYMPPYKPFVNPADRVLAAINGNREWFAGAFIAETGLAPSDVVMVQQTFVDRIEISFRAKTEREKQNAAEN